MMIYIKSLFICVHIGLSMIGGLIGMAVGVFIAFILFLIGVPNSYVNPIGPYPGSRFRNCLFYRNLPAAFSNHEKTYGVLYGPTDDFKHILPFL